MADDGKNLDLSKEAPGGAKKPFKEEPYDPREQEDTARRKIAYILLAMLGIVLAWALASITICPSSEKSTVEVLQIVWGPIIALVSAATGFYFGAKSNH